MLRRRAIPRPGSFASARDSHALAIGKSRDSFAVELAMFKALPPRDFWQDTYVKRRPVRCGFQYASTGNIPARVGGRLLHRGLTGIIQPICIARRENRFGGANPVNRRREASIDGHQNHRFDNLFPRDTDIERPMDMHL